MAGSRKKQYNREQILFDLEEAREIIAPMITNVMPVIYDHHHKGNRVLGEAGQGILLDLDRGSYPNVTSSHPGIAGFCLATGIHPREVNRVVGVTKVYATRVGNGPLPTELIGDVGDYIREKGGEYGTTTGRPRRCGWFDMPAINYGVSVGGVTSLALTKIDIFDELPEVKICVGYRVGGRVYTSTPDAETEFMNSVHPVYETIPGWEKETTGVRSFGDLPGNAQNFVKIVQELAGIPVELVSVGPERGSSIYL